MIKLTVSDYENKKSIEKYFSSKEKAIKWILDNYSYIYDSYFKVKDEFEELNFEFEKIIVDGD